MGRMFLNGKEYGGSLANVSQSIVEFQSDDALESKSSIDIPLIEGRETVGGFAKKISRVARNVRYLLHILGTADISLRGDGTVTGAIGALSEVAFTGDYRDLSEAPDVGAGTVTIKQGGQLAGSFSVNQKQNAEIDLSVSQGPKGDDGVSVSKIEQVTTSTADGGTNVFRVTLSNGKSADFSVKNGSKGSTGAKGDTGARGATGPQGPAGVNATTTSVATQTANGLQSAADKKKLDGIPSDTKAQLDELNTGIPTMTLTDVWQICYKIAGWDMFAQIPLVSTSQKLTVTSASIFLNGSWQALGIKRALSYGGYLRVEFQNISSLAVGMHLCRITGKLEK